MVQFVESSYKFTDPIRYFKANDPIYYEVENIPLKQLQENDLWIKDQLDKLNSNSFGGVTPGEIDRSSFSELKPYVNGSDNIVRVRPGRFIARINDAYNITPLQYIKNITGSAINEYEGWTAVAAQDMMISSVINRFRSNVVSQALNMNGLVERAFSYPAQSPDRASNYLNSTTPTINSISNVEGDQFQPIYPLKQVQLWNVFTFGENNETTFNLRQYDTDNVNVGFASMNSAESEFIKRWRGVARTAVVDLAEETSIEIPAFNENDFYYLDTNEVKQKLTNASQRIDLLFIYSKPIDMSGTTVAKFLSTGQPTTITTPTLGIVYGAGIGVNFKPYTRQFKKIENGTLTGDNYGSLKMLPHIGDQAGQNTGFKVSGLEIKGSFPSPDDLMNLTPILDEELSTNHFGLIGQSILPLAYIVVKKSAQANDNGIRKITTNDVIDIRPFFRTTELSYNERAGIAAAVPSLSIANPIVTQSELKYEVNRAYKDLLGRIPNDTGNGGNTSLAGIAREIACGYVLGGLKYGVEGVLATYLASEKNQNSPISEMGLNVKSAYNYPSSIELSETPQWDLAEWAKNIGGAGSNINDRINIYQLRNRPSEILWNRTYINTNFLGSNTQFPNKYTTAKESGASWTNGVGWQTDKRIAYPATYNDHKMLTVHFWFVRKKIYITLPRGINDYQVNVKLLNCLNLSHQPINITQFSHTGSNAIWVEKGKDTRGNYFVINVAWPAKPIGIADNTYNPGGPFANRDWDINYYDYTADNWPGQLGFAAFDSVNANNTLATINARRGLNPLGFRDVGELTAGWLVSNPDLINLTYGGTGVTKSSDRGKVNMGICNYPSVMFSVVGYPSSYLNSDLSVSEPTINAI